MVDVCHIGFGYYPGAGLTAMYEYSRRQANLGLRVHAIALTGDDRKSRQTIEGVDVFLFPAQSTSARSPEKVHFFRHAVQVLSSLSFDIVHVYSSIGVFCLPLLGRRYQEEAIWIYDVRSGPVHPGISAWIGKQSMIFESRFFDTVFCQSEGSRDLVFGDGRRDIFISRQGADLELFKSVDQGIARDSLDLHEEETILVLVSTLHHTRRIETVLQAFRIVLESSSRPMRLMILGDGPDFQRLSGLAHQLQLDSQVTFTGYIDYERVPLYLAAADVGIAYVPATAEYAPQPPLKTAEMLSSGLPVIATNTRGNRHFIRDGFNGVLCDDSPRAVANAVIDLLDDNLKRERLRTVARRSIRPYHWETIVRDSILPRYHQLLNCRSR